MRLEKQTNELTGVSMLTEQTSMILYSTSTEVYTVPVNNYSNIEKRIHVEVFNNDISLLIDK